MLMLPRKRGWHIREWTQCGLPSPGPKPDQRVATLDEELPKTKLST